MVSSATPVMRTVLRMEFPWHRALMTRTRFSVAMQFMMASICWLILIVKCLLKYFLVFFNETGYSEIIVDTKDSIRHQ